MQKAQHQIMASLVSNHEIFAASLEEYSIVVKKGKGASRAVISQQMGDSAMAFRQRGLQGQKNMVDLNQATQDLLSRALICLKQD